MINLIITFSALAVLAVVVAICENVPAIGKTMDKIIDKIMEV